MLIATSNLETTDCQPNQGRTTSQSHEEALAAVIKREYQLRRFAIKLLGVLFRSRTGESDKRHHYIDLLRRVAVASSYGILDWARKKKGAGLSNEEFIRTCGLLKCEEMKLKLTAIRQLEACLDASFTSLPHTHANVPGIMKALCDTARFYISIEYNVGAELDHHIVGRLMMTLASILPIARLSCGRNGQGVLIPRHCVTRNIPKDMLSALSMNEDVYDFRPAVVNESSDSEDLAPFVFVKQREYNQWSADEARQMRRRQASRDNNITLDGKQGTLVDFGPVASVVKHVLCVVSSASYRHDEGMNIFEGVVSQSSLSTLPSVLCTVLYTILSRLLSHGMAFPGADDLPWLEINSTPDAGDCVEEVLTARSQSVSDFAGILGYYIVSQIGDKGSILQLSRTVCSVLVHMSKSICRKVVQHACCGLILILSSLRHSMEGKSTNDEIHDTTLSDCAVSFVGYVSFALRRETTRSSSHMLIPLIDGAYCHIF